MTSRIPILLFPLSLLGCAATPKPIAHPRVIEMEPMRIEVSRKGGAAEFDAYDAATLFEQAGAALNGGQHAAAAAGYDRLVKQFPDSRYVVPSLYNAGLALEGVKDYAGAVLRYRALVDKSPESRDALDALFRMGACYAETGNWAASAETFARALPRKDLSLGDRVEALARRGLAQYHMNDQSASERTFREALQYYHDNETVERLESDFYLALCQYQLAEIAHDQFRAVAVRLPETQMKRDLEEKAQLLLLAQARYVDTARIRNPAWATAAGFQMAQLYKEFYDALIGAPIPPQLASDEAKQIYRDELKKQIEPLLRKAIHAHELTQMVAERNGVDNEWVRRSSEQMEQLRALVGAPAPSAPITPPRSRDGREEKLNTPPPRHDDDYHPRVLL